MLDTQLHENTKNGENTESEIIASLLSGADDRFADDQIFSEKSRRNLSDSARNLAKKQRLVQKTTIAGKRGDGDGYLLERFRDNAKWLEQIYRQLNYYRQKDRRGRSAAVAWFTDNFYVIAEHLRAVTVDLPPAFYSRLPKLVKNEAEHQEPRVYSICKTFLDERENNFQIAPLEIFIDCFQAIKPLEMGELWAVPITLRLALIEHLRLLMESAVAFLQRDEGTDISAQKRTAEKAAYIVTALKLIETIDWRDFFERVSLVHRALADDPAQIYEKMEFATRDAYRHAVERIASGSRQSEIQTTLTAIALAYHAANEIDEETERRKNHVGFYLVGEGVPLLEKLTGYRASNAEKLRRMAFKNPTLPYLGAIFVLTASVVSLAGWLTLPLDAPLWMIGLIIILTALPASEIAVALTNQAVAGIFPPHVVPKIDLSKTGIPEDAKTIVVIPCLLTSLETITELVERLEIHFLANPDPHLYFALLGDFSDAYSEEAAADRALMEKAQDGIAKLNLRYPREAIENHAARFHLFVRRRRWSECENKWLGWERKRGKLVEFNRLLRGSAETSFFAAAKAEERDFLKQIRFCLTLDADTNLPRDAARRLVGTFLHPLNRPRFCKQKNRINEG